MTTKIKYVTPSDAKGLNTLIEAAIKSAKTMQIKVQIAAVAILMHAHKCGDYTQANRIIDDLGNGVKRDSLVAFFAKYGGLEVGKVDGKDKFVGWKGKAFIEANLKDAKENMWYSLKQANPFKGFNLEEELTKLLKRHEKQRKDMAKLTDEQRELVAFDVSEATIKRLMSICNFEAIVEDSEEKTTLDEQLKVELAKAS